jgi:DNA-binding Xre family transcriptional regulator
MIKKRVREVAESQGYTSAYQLRVALGVSPSLASRLWKGEFEKIGIGTLDKLCELLNCQADKLLPHVSQEPKAGVKGRKGSARARGAKR